MYKNYIFDLYGTLIDISTNEENQDFWKQICLFFGYNGANYEPAEFRETYINLIHEEERKLSGACSVTSNRYKHESFPEVQLEYIFQDMYRLKGVETNMDLCLYTGKCFRALSTQYIKLYDGVENLLKRIKEENGNIYMLSNAQRIFTEYEVKMLGIYDYFDDILISSDYLCKKPDKNFMLKLIEKNNVEVDKSIMIGNDLSTDIAIANSVGMDSLFIRSNLSPSINYEYETIDATFYVEKMDLQKVIDMIV